jgi:TM2 domain-containing membrane protein YozV
MTNSAVTMMRYDNAKKSVGVAYLLWFLLGGLAVHRFYLRKHVSAIILLVLWILSVALIPVGVGLVLMIVPGLWLLVDLFLIPGIVRDHNDAIIEALSGEEHA